MELNLRHYLIDWLNDWGYNALDELAEYDIRVARDERYPNLFNLKYGTIMADKADPLVRACRGAVVERVDNDGDHSPYYRLVAYAFDRFFNVGEGYCHELDWSRTKVYEKYDGCLHAETKVETSKGTKTIKEICEKPDEVKVYGFDHKSGEKVEVPIEAVSVKQCKPNTQWYKITLENGNTIVLTGNHKVWDEVSHSYIRVDQLSGEEELKEFT
jgi:hypothetical protein